MNGSGWCACQRIRWVCAECRGFATYDTWEVEKHVLAFPDHTLGGFPEGITPLEIIPEGRAK